jgi:hypothetical protein
MLLALSPNWCSISALLLLIEHAYYLSVHVHKSDEYKIIIYSIIFLSER